MHDSISSSNSEARTGDAACPHDAGTLETLPCVGVRADLERIAESLGAALLTTIEADLVCVRFTPAGQEPVVATAGGRDPAWAETLASFLREPVDAWVRERDPEEVLELGGPGGDGGTLRVIAHPVGAGAELGIVAAAYAGDRGPRDADHRVLKLVAAQAHDAVETAALLRSVRERERDLADFFESASIGMHWVGPDGIIRRANQAELDMLGYSREEFVGRHIAEFHADQVVIEDLLDRLRRGESVREHPARLRCKDGSFRDVLISSSARFESGRFVHTRCITQDVTGQRLAEERLRESEERYALVLAGAGAAIWDWNVAEGRVMFSPHWKALRGLADDEVGDREEEWSSGIHPDDVQRVMSAIRDHFEGRTPVFSEEYRVRHKDGRWVWILDRGIAKRDAEGNVVRMAGSETDITERKQAERALRESEEHFRGTFENAAVGIAHEGPDGRWIRINDRYCEILGYSRRELLGMSFEEVTHPEDLVAERVHVQRLARGEIDRYSMEKRYIRKDGTPVPVIVTVAPARTPDGSAYFITTAVEISARKAAEAQLRFQTFALDASSIVAITDVDGTITYVNEKFCEISGYSRQELLGQNHRIINSGVHPREFFRQMYLTISRGEVWHGEICNRRKDGTLYWVDTTIVPAMGEDGRPERYVAIRNDITARHESEQALRESEERFRTLADNMSQFAWMGDETGSLFWYNQRWYDYTGTTLEEMRGWGWRKVHHPDHVERVTEKFRDHVVRGEPWEDTFPLRARDGSYRWFLSRALPIRDERGRVVRWFGTNTDITEQRAAEMELALHKDELEKRVEERTRELMATYERLRSSERMAMMGTLSAGLGHDMGNLLVPVRIRLESLVRESLSEQAREDVEAISMSAEYLRRLANGLRLLALDPDRSPPGETTDLPTWWADAQGVLRSVLPRGIALEREFPETGCVVRMSKAALTQVVFNLVQNAGDAMKGRGSGRVVVRGACEERWVIIGVSDDGPGMSPEVRARCAEPFFTTKTRGISTGLGLVLVHGLVRDAGGSVELESEPGKGTTFTLRLPQANVPETGDQRGAGVAILELRDARMRSFIAGELRALSFDVGGFGEASEADALFVLDDAAKLEGVPRGAPVVLLGDGGPGDERVRILGVRPSISTIRQTLREIAGERRRREPGEGERA